MSAAETEPPAEPGYYCGCCAGRQWIYCPHCVVGCSKCVRTGRVQCPDCVGGDWAPRPPEW